MEVNNEIVLAVGAFVGTAFTALSTAVAFLFKMHNDGKIECEKGRAKCEEESKLLANRVSFLEGQISTKGQSHDPRP